MNREPVASSSVRSMGFDAAAETLEVEFADGGVYQYYNVTEALYEQMRDAPSKGQFLNTYIRTTHPYSRVG